jgi:hypothetical protein
MAIYIFYLTIMYKMKILESFNIIHINCNINASKKSIKLVLEYGRFKLKVNIKEMPINQNIYSLYILKNTTINYKV